MSIEGIDNINCPSSPADRQKLKSALTEMTYCLQRIDDERSAMKDVAEATAEKFGLPKKMISKLARTMYKRDYETLSQENEDFELLYETLVEGQKAVDQIADNYDIDNVTAIS